MSIQKMADPEETKREKARNLRYRKAIIRDVNLDKIQEDLYEIMEECDNVKYFFEDDEETLLNALDGDEDDAFEYKMMFADLCAECEQMQSDLHYEYVPECFDNFFTAVSSSGDSLFGWDSFEGDYLGLGGNYEEDLARKEAQKRLIRMNKEQIIESAQICFRIFRSYIGLRHRYDCLKAALDILRDDNTRYLQVVKRINEIYEKADADGFIMWHDSEKEFDALLDQMPPMAWIQ